MEAARRLHRGADLHLVDAYPRYEPARLIPPRRRGYIYVAAAVDPPARAPFVFPSGRRSALAVELKALARRLRERNKSVLEVDVFRAIMMAPSGNFFAYVKQHPYSFRVPSFDLLLLIQTTSVGSALDLERTSEHRALVERLRAGARDVFVMPARNVKRIGDVDTTRPGLFLFNHFAAEDDDVMLRLWDYLAGWYVAETALRNSVALAPLERDRSGYTIVNWARWDVAPARHFLRSLVKPRSSRYVTANLEANHAASMPVYCRLA